MRPGAEGPVRGDAPGKFEVTVLPPTKKAPSSSRVRGPPRVAECAGATPEASVAIARVRLKHAFIVDFLRETWRLYRGSPRRCTGIGPVAPQARALLHGHVRWHPSCLLCSRSSCSALPNLR